MTSDLNVGLMICMPKLNRLGLFDRAGFKVPTGPFTLCCFGSTFGAERFYCILVVNVNNFEIWKILFYRSGEIMIVVKNFINFTSLIYRIRKW